MTDLTRATLFSDPRIRFLKTQLESLLSLVIFEKNGEPVAVDGFRLKDLSDWLVPLSLSHLESIGSPSTHCNLDCVFCYERGNSPDGLVWEGKRPFLTVGEASARFDLHSSKEQKCLAPVAGEVKEPFLNPHYLGILRLARQKAPQEYFRLITNGSFLTEPTVNELSRLQPLEILVSLNTTDPELRRQLMQDPHPNVAIDGISLLNKYQIPFIGGIVAWHTFSIEDIKQTIRYLDAQDAVCIKIHLGGYSRYFSPNIGPDLQRHWNRVMALVRKMRKSIKTPILFSMELFVNNDTVPRILGIIDQSPGMHAGLKPGDILTRVKDRSVATQFEARLLLRRWRESEINLEILRHGKKMEMSLVPAKTYKYPYTKAIHDNRSFSGIMIAEGPNPLNLRDLEAIIRSHGAEKILLLSSTVMKPIFETLIERYYDTSKIDLSIEVPAHRYWGGNIIVGDLYTVSDYIAHIKDYINKNGIKPHLVIIPSSPFSMWGHDLTGSHYSDIERHTNVPVEFIRTARIMGA